MPLESDINRRVQELLTEARKADKVDRDRAELFGAMVKTKAWQEYVMLLEARLQAMGDLIIAPGKSVDGMVALEYVKGTMSGLVIARDLPSITIAAMDQLMRDRLQGADYDVDDTDEENSDA